MRCDALAEAGERRRVDARGPRSGEAAPRASSTSRHATRRERGRMSPFCASLAFRALEPSLVPWLTRANPSTSSAAGSPAAKRPGRRRAPACRWCCTRCGRCAAPPAHQTAASPSWSAPTPSAPTMPTTMRSGLLHEEMRRRRLADHAPRPMPTSMPAGGALAVDRDGFSADDRRGARSACPRSRIAREEIGRCPPPTGRASSSPPAR